MPRAQAKARSRVNGCGASVAFAIAHQRLRSAGISWLLFCMSDSFRVRPSGVPGDAITVPSIGAGCKALEGFVRDFLKIVAPAALAPPEPWRGSEGRRGRAGARRVALAALGRSAHLRRGKPQLHGERQEHHDPSERGHGTSAARSRRRGFPRHRFHHFAGPAASTMQERAACAAAPGRVNPGVCAACAAPNHVQSAWRRCMTGLSPCGFPRCGAIMHAPLR